MVGAGALPERSLAPVATLPASSTTRFQGFGMSDAAAAKAKRAEEKAAREAAADAKAAATPAEDTNADTPPVPTSENPAPAAAPKVDTKPDTVNGRGKTHLQVIVDGHPAEWVDAVEKVSGRALALVGKDTPENKVHAVGAMKCGTLVVNGRAYDDIAGRSIGTAGETVRVTFTMRDAIGE
jgi:hypothetical protein